MSQVRKQVSYFGLSLVFTFLAVFAVFASGSAGVIGGLLMAGLLSGLTLVIGGIAMAIQYYRNQSAFEDKQKAGADMSVSQSRTIEIDLSFERAYDLALEAVESMDGDDIPKTLTGIASQQTVKLHKADAGIGRIEAGLRAKTFGIKDVLDFSKVTIQLQRLDGDATRLQIESKPSNSLEVMDMGRHTHYVNYLSLYIRKQVREADAIRHLSEDDSQARDISVGVESSEGRQQSYE